MDEYSNEPAEDGAGRTLKGHGQSPNGLLKSWSLFSAGPHFFSRERASLGAGVT